jgi:dTDP-4-amino-4,6-dideoxygalactose transaminase
MKYPYYNPNLHLSVLVKALFLSKVKARRKIKEYFQNLTGKKYILITNSCKTALYLSYKALEIPGEVITSPLTCKVAIDPIKASGNKSVYADIREGDLNINPEDIEQRINEKTIAIQAIHLGGVSCDMDSINKTGKNNKLWVIEDCAQSFGAKFKGKYTGSFGDIACFSFIKNTYGIGGGILSTNHQGIYTKARELQELFPNTSKLLTCYRIIRNFIETYRRTLPGKLFYNILMKIKGQKFSYTRVEDQLKNNLAIATKINAIQLSRIEKLHTKRKEVGKQFYTQLNDKGLITNHRYKPDNSSFTKFFVFFPEFETIPLLEKLHKNGIEAMHLEHKMGSPYQEKLIDAEKVHKTGLKQYLNVHDSVISLPIREEYNEKDLNKILEILDEYIDCNRTSSAGS